MEKTNAASTGKTRRNPSAWTLAAALALAGAAYGQAPVQFEDGTGTIRVRVKTCDWVQSHAHPENGRQVAETTCGPDDDDGDGEADWALIGGGAEICCLTGATLNRNAPDTDNLWWASSSGTSSEPHQLRAWAILMQLVGNSGLPFVPGTQVMDDNFETCVPDNAGVCINHGKWSRAGGSAAAFIGGGAQIIPEGQARGGLTESRPVVDGTGEIVWRVGARLGSGDVSVRAWLLGIDLCPEQWYGDCLSYPILKELVSTATSGYNTVASDVAESWVPTSIGGKAVAQGNDVRYLDDMVPLNGTSRGFFVQSKPGSTQNPGATLGSALLIGKSAAPYQYNAVRFNTPGTSLYRHPTSNRLWQTNVFPLDERGRWHLDRVSASVHTVYLLRNGNPDQGTECAYWAGGSDVRVAACEENNPAFHWFKIGESVFQLQADTSPNLCLDNLNQGSTISSLRVQTCNNGYSDAQSLFLDAYGWPVSATNQSATLGFETLSKWSSTAPLSLSTSLKTEGASGLSVGGSNYRLVTSAPVRTPVSGPGTTLLLDVYVPGQQPNPYWTGAVQTFVDCPAAQLGNVYIGQAELTGLPTGAFSTLQYTLPQAVRNVLSQPGTDCTFGIGVNMNATPVKPVLDNLRVAP